MKIKPEYNGKEENEPREPWIQEGITFFKKKWQRDIAKDAIREMNLDEQRLMEKKIESEEPLASSTVHDFGGDVEGIYEYNTQKGEE